MTEAATRGVDMRKSSRPQTPNQAQAEYEVDAAKSMDIFGSHAVHYANMATDNINANHTSILNQWATKQDRRLLVTFKLQPEFEFLFLKDSESPAPIAVESLARNDPASVKAQSPQLPLAQDIATTGVKVAPSIANSTVRSSSIVSAKQTENVPYAQDAASTNISDPFTPTAQSGPLSSSPTVDLDSTVYHDDSTEWCTSATAALNDVRKILEQGTPLAFSSPEPSVYTTPKGFSMIDESTLHLQSQFSPIANEALQNDTMMFINSMPDIITQVAPTPQACAYGKPITPASASFGTGTPRFGLPSKDALGSIDTPMPIRSSPDVADVDADVTLAVSVDFERSSPKSVIDHPVNATLETTVTPSPWSSPGIGNGATDATLAVSINFDQSLDLAVASPGSPRVDGTPIGNDTTALINNLDETPSMLATLYPHDKSGLFNLSPATFSTGTPRFGLPTFGLPSDSPFNHTATPSALSSGGVDAAVVQTTAVSVKSDLSSELSSSFCTGIPKCSSVHTKTSPTKTTAAEPVPNEPVPAKSAYTEPSDKGPPSTPKRAPERQKSAASAVELRVEAEPTDPALPITPARAPEMQQPPAPVELQAVTEDDENREFLKNWVLKQKATSRPRSGSKSPALATSATGSPQPRKPLATVDANIVSPVKKAAKRKAAADDTDDVVPSAPPSKRGRRVAQDATAPARRSSRVRKQNEQVEAAKAASGPSCSTATGNSKLPRRAVAAKKAVPSADASLAAMTRANTAANRGEAIHATDYLAARAKDPAAARMADLKDVADAKAARGPKNKGAKTVGWDTPLATYEGEENDKKVPKRSKKAAPRAKKAAGPATPTLAQKAGAKRKTLPRPATPAPKRARSSTKK